MSGSPLFVQSGMSPAKVFPPSFGVVSIAGTSRPVSLILFRLSFSCLAGSASSAVSTFCGFRVLWGVSIGSAARGNLTFGLVDWSHHSSQVKSIADRWFGDFQMSLGRAFRAYGGRYGYESEGFWAVYCVLRRCRRVMYPLLIEV